MSEKDPRVQGYAAALFQIAQAEGALEQVEDELEKAIERAIEQSAEVMVVRHHDDLGPLGRIGAVLRY